MVELKITKAPEPQTVNEGEKAEFTATAEGTAPFKFSWKVGTAEWTEPEDPGGDTSTHTIDKATRDLDGATVAVRVTDSETTTAVESAAVKLTVLAKEEPILWVSAFARNATIVIVVALVALLIPALIALGAALDSETDEVALGAGIALVFVIVGVFVVAAGVFLALLEFRGRARTLEELQELLGERGKPGVDEAVNLADLIKALPETLKAFGQLRATAALLAMATVLFVCGTVIAVEVADADEPSTTTTDTTSVVDEPSENATTGP